MTAATTFDSLERLAETFGSKQPSKRMLVIVNPYATTVSDRLKHLVVYALQGRYQVDSVETEARGHATELCREAAQEGYDVVCAFGGDGTVNEAANGLAGSGTPLTCLPGGSTNVFARILGIPNDVVDATEHMLRMADDWRPRPIDLGIVNDRRFLFTAGMGLDASVTRRVDARPRLKARFGPWFYSWAAVSAFNRDYVVKPPKLVAELPGGETIEGVTAMVQNTMPYTYFGTRPIDLAEGVALDDGTLAGVVLKRASPLDMPTVTWRALSGSARIVGHRRVAAFSGSEAVTVRSRDDRELPLQVDGDYLGTVPEAVFGVDHHAVQIVA
ncbi:diacylglycerol kinase family protein [Conexibacter sp. CPCC 206217]|uniref:diacylglycerol/lipid kinase family protein n=1 Tax=Conexibacter sp. CPCC 206217 TaxID=3064574 RepID=UPI002719B65B|nr:diacylglycerol kinase family protein [Conexibacter sp. CPCC 206217]MDO8210728.1 diacylglycerol kinase family lipid kinase [Conexibacter sp. CPCC 206217]